jgi:hypothetical protein
MYICVCVHECACEVFVIEEKSKRNGMRSEVDFSMYSSENILTKLT